METILAFCIGITLSAACGFRVFIRTFIMSLGSIYGDFPLTGGFQWLGTYPAAIRGAATVVLVLLVLAAKKLLKYFKQKKNNFQMKIR